MPTLFTLSNDTVHTLPVASSLAIGYWLLLWEIICPRSSIPIMLFKTMIGSCTDLQAPQPF